MRYSVVKFYSSAIHRYSSLLLFGRTPDRQLAFSTNDINIAYRPKNISLPGPVRTGYDNFECMRHSGFNLLCPAGNRGNDNQRRVR